MCLLRKPFSAGRVLVVLAALLMHAHVIRAAEGDALVAVPDDAAQARRVALIREVYEQDYQTANTSADRTALAKKMVDQAGRTLDDPVARFVLLRVAHDMAAQAGDAETAVDAVDRLARAYDVDADAMKADALVKAAANAKSTEARKGSGRAFARLGPSVPRRRRLSDRRPPLGNRAGGRSAGSETAGSSRKTMALRTRAAEAGQAYAEVKKGLATLGEKPTDPEANLAVGGYYAFVKGDWEKAIPMLALADGAPFCDLAQRDLQGPTSSREQVRLADDWWTLAETKEGSERTALLLRAGTWYGRARPGLSPGLAQVKVDRRLEEVDKLGRPATTPESLRLPEGRRLGDDLRARYVRRRRQEGLRVGRERMSAITANSKGAPRPRPERPASGSCSTARTTTSSCPTLRAHLVKDLKAITISMWVKPVGGQGIRLHPRRRQPGRQELHRPNMVRSGSPLPVRCAAASGLLLGNRRGRPVATLCSQLGRQRAKALPRWQAASRQPDR